MKLKIFDLSIESNDPKPINLHVKSLLFSLTGGNLHHLLPTSIREFTEDDYVDFDTMLSPVIGISVNDLAHGKYDVKTLEFDGLSIGEYLIILQVEDKKNNRFQLNFIVVKITEGQISKLYSDDLYTKESSIQRLEKIASLLGINEKNIVKILRETGVKID